MVSCRFSHGFPMDFPMFALPWRRFCCSWRTARSGPWPCRRPRASARRWWRRGSPYNIHIISIYHHISIYIYIIYLYDILYVIISHNITYIYMDYIYRYDIPYIHIYIYIIISWYITYSPIIEFRQKPGFAFWDIAVPTTFLSIRLKKPSCT